MTKTAVIPLSENYVNYWSVGAALREFWANAKDGARNVEDNFGKEYDESTSRLIIWNKSAAKLSPSMLVLGHTEKSKESANVGQFGEGAKVGFCRLSKEGVRIKCLNMDEVWTIYFKYDKGYDAKVLHVDIEPAKAPIDCIKFVFEGVTAEHMEGFNRFLLETAIESGKAISDKAGEGIETSVGTIYPYLDRQVFVSGILIPNTTLMWAVDLHPDQVALTRDRDSISWSESKDLERKMAIEAAPLLANKDMPDYSAGSLLRYVIGGIEDEEDQGNLEGATERNKEVLELLTKNVQERTETAEKVVLDYSDIEKAQQMGFKAIVLSSTERKALRLLGKEKLFESKEWSSDSLAPNALLPRLANKWEKMQKLMAEAGIEQSEIDDMDSTVKLIANIGKQSWYIS